MREYRERLHVPLAWWLLALPSALIIGATVYAGLRWPWPIIIVGGLLAGCTALLISLGRGSVEVGADGIRAGGAVLPLAAVRDVVALDEPRTIALRGPRADPAALLYSRPFLRESVYLAVDPAVSGGGVPYWVIGTRHPAELAAAVERCRVQTGHEPVA
jgi:hypothetical protein